MAWLKMLTLFVLMPGVADALLPWLVLIGTHRFTFSGWGVLQVIGLLLIAVGLGVLAWVGQAFFRGGKGTPAPFDPPHRFVSEGLYRWVRNPMYLAVGTLIPLGEVLFFASLWMVPYTLLLMLLLHLYVIYHEEPALVRRFGRPYKKYLRTIPRWLPRLPHE